MSTLSFPEMKNLNAMGEKVRNNKRFSSIPESVAFVKEELEKIAPKNREKYFLSKEFIKLCKEEQVYAVIGCTKTHSIRILDPNDNKIQTVHFFDEQTKNILKFPESVVISRKHGIQTTSHKRTKPLPIKQMEDSVIEDIIADIYVCMRKVIFDNKKIGTRNILSVWIKDYPYEVVASGDFNNKHKDDILLFSAEQLRKYQPVEIDKYKAIKYGSRREVHKNEDNSDD